jgi:creatinine amidohydrolase
MNDDPRFEFSELTYTQVEALLREERAIVLLWPIGSTEAHGPHAPLATDSMISTGMCRHAAARLADDPELRALVLPPLSYGVTRYTSAFAGTVHIDEETLHAVVTDVLGSLIAQGLRHNAIVNNHFEPEHVQTLHRAIDTVLERTGVLTAYLDLTRRHRAKALTDEFRRRGSHAGQYETSLVLAERPELVDRDLLASLPEVPINLADSLSAGHKDFAEIGMDQAYNGSPALASGEEGNRSFEVLTELLVEQLRALVRGTGGRDEPGLYGRL